LSEDLFLFSNQDFTIPISVLVRDTATINNVVETSEKTETNELRYLFTGVAEVPTVFAESTTGPSLSYVPVTLGGESTDQDVLLGREPSESVYYIVSDQDAVGMPFDYSVSCLLHR
jgi:hypothetical protein